MHQLGFEGTRPGLFCDLFVVLMDVNLQREIVLGQNLLLLLRVHNM